MQGKQQSDHDITIQDSYIS